MLFHLMKPNSFPLCVSCTSFPQVASSFISTSLLKYGCHPHYSFKPGQLIMTFPSLVEFSPFSFSLTLSIILPFLKWFPLNVHDLAVLTKTFFLFLLTDSWLLFIHPPQKSDFLCLICWISSCLFFFFAYSYFKSYLFPKLFLEFPRKFPVSTPTPI